MSPYEERYEASVDRLLTARRRGRITEAQFETRLARVRARRDEQAAKHRRLDRLDARDTYRRLTTEQKNRARLKARATRHTYKEGLMPTTYTRGDLVIIGGRLATIHRPGKRGNAPGYWAASHTRDPGATAGLPSFAPEHTVRPAVLGQTVCETPWGACTCGKVHVTHPDTIKETK